MWSSVNRHYIAMCIICFLCGGLAASVQAAPVTLVEDGTAKCCVVVGPDAAFTEPPFFNWTPKNPLLAWAAEDVVNYLGKMSGARVPVGDKPVAGLLPVYVGCPPEPVRFARTTEYGDAYVVDVTPARVILHGESRHAVYYAAADLLDSLGVRWYAPGDIGEVVPRHTTVTVDTGRREAQPDFLTRRLWCAGPEPTRWMYRNRLGDATVPCGHSMHAYGANLPGWRDRQAEQHTDFYSRVKGKAGYFPNLANPAIPPIFAAHAVKLLTEGPRGGRSGGKQAVGATSISPDDGYLQDERPEVVAMNSPGRDPILGMPSFSDAWFKFASDVCAEIDKQAPELDYHLGSLAYMNYLLPPMKTKPHPRIIPVVAPIAFNRYVSIGTPGAPTSELLAEIIQGWTTLSPRVGVYLYNFNLADMAMPYTRRVHWTKDIPRLFAWGVRDFTCESHPNWHTMMPGNYVAARLLWDTKTDVDKLLDAYYLDYYGPAAQAMHRYDATLEQAYETTTAFAGGVWAMHRILTPEVMTTLDQALTEAEGQVKGKGVYAQRVEIVRYSLTFAKNYFAIRDALQRYDFAEAEQQAVAFDANYQAGFAKYPLFFGVNRIWSPNIQRYFELFHFKALRDAGRMARDSRIVYRLPDELSAHLEVVEGGAKPSGRMPDTDTDTWRPMKTFTATLDEQGLPFFRGVIWYRHRFNLPADSREATPLTLYFSGVDSRTHVWLNGQDLGEKFVGSFGTWAVDLTPAIRRDGPNDLLVAVDNTFPNDIGVGGIIRPAVICTPREH